MRVYNEKVDRCCECPMLDHLDMEGSPFCGILNEEVDNNKIHPDCPFSKPITKDVIEGFGFKIFNYRNIECFNLKNYLLFKFENNNFISIDKFPDTPRHCESGNNCFRGTINNPEELKFILTAIGVI